MLITFLLLFGLTAFFIFVGRLLAGKKGMVIAFIAALVMNVVLNWYSDTIMLKAYNIHPAPEHHRLVMLTREISEKAGLLMSRLYIIPSKSPNILSPENAVIAATEGLLSLLNDNELMGVIAHEIGHVKNRDTIIQTVSASISGAVTLLSLFALFFVGSRRLGWAKTITIAIIAPIAASIITLAVSRQREYKADEYAGRLTGEPMFLASALQKLDMQVRHPVENHSPRSPHMLIGNLISGVGNWELFSTHPPVEKRVRRLSKLATELRQ